MDDADAAEVDETPGRRPGRRRQLLLVARSTTLRALGCLVIAGIIGTPLALAWAVTHTEVHDAIGTSPTTLTLSTRGNSELRLGLPGMELDTSGGAIDTPTLNNFSTPWSRPSQEASFPVVFLDQETRMVTGYQLYRFATDGTATVLPRVDVGVPPVESTSVALQGAP